MTVITDRFGTEAIVIEQGNSLVVWVPKRKEFIRIACDEFLEVWRHIHNLWMTPHICGALRFGSGRMLGSGFIW